MHPQSFKQLCRCYCNNNDIEQTLPPPQQQNKSTTTATSSSSGTNTTTINTETLLSSTFSSPRSPKISIELKTSINSSSIDLPQEPSSKLTSSQSNDNNNNNNNNSNNNSDDDESFLFKELPNELDHLTILNLDNYSFHIWNKPNEKMFQKSAIINEKYKEEFEKEENELGKLKYIKTPVKLPQYYKILIKSSPNEEYFKENIKLLIKNSIKYSIVIYENQNNINNDLIIFKDNISIYNLINSSQYSNILQKKLHSLNLTKVEEEDDDGDGDKKDMDRIYLKNLIKEIHKLECDYSLVDQFYIRLDAKHHILTIFDSSVYIYCYYIILLYLIV